MAKKDTTRNECTTRKSKRATRTAQVDVASHSETLNVVGHLLTPIPDADIKWAKSYVKKCQKK